MCEEVCKALMRLMCILKLSFIIYNAEMKNYDKILFLVASKLVLITVHNQRDIYTTRKEFIATELTLYM